jgi:predicted outer membrane repeat protein
VRNRFVNLLIAVISLSTGAWASLGIARGHVTASTSWDADTMIMFSDVIIDSGATVTIKKGVIVQFPGHYQITVKGAIRASGTGANPVVFCPTDTTVTWKGIVFDKTPPQNDSSILEYCFMTQANKKADSLTDSAGGALVVQGMSKLRVSHCSFKKNTAYFGGAICVRDSAAPHIVSCSIDSNWALEFGGAAWVTGNSSPTFDSCTFSANRGTNGKYPQPHGYAGGMYVSGESSPRLNACQFSHNMADEGAALYNENSSSPVLTACTFSNNGGGSVFLNRGGAILNLNASSPFITGCRFENNYMGGQGGGKGGAICNVASSPTIVSSVFIGNYASASARGLGGAIFNSSSSPQVVNCLFVNNFSDTGAVMYNSYSSPVIVNCTMTLDSAGRFANGIFNTGVSVPVVKNSIFWDKGPGIENISPATSLVSYSCVKGGSAGQGNISIDPMFIDSTYADSSIADFSLKAGSPCINKGTASLSGITLPALDLSGNTRIQDAVVDMGAFEFAPPVGNIRAGNGPVAQDLFAGQLGSGNGRLELRVPAGESPTLRLFSCDGRTIMSRNVSAGKTILDINALHLSNGYYILRLQGKKLMQQKILVPGKR